MSAHAREIIITHYIHFLTKLIATAPNVVGQYTPMDIFRNCTVIERTRILAECPIGVDTVLLERELRIITDEYEKKLRSYLFKN